jgi:GntR family transcriptional regulator
MPLYLQLAQKLKQKIRSGEISTGDTMPSERELMMTYQVSRNTIRQAIDLLEREGLVERIQGKGTFITNPRLKIGLMRLSSFTEDMLERNMTPASRLLDRRMMAPPEHIARMLGILPGEQALFIERLRFADEIPMALNVSYFAIQNCPGLAVEDVNSESIYSLLEKKYGLQLARAEQSVRAAPAEPHEAHLLEIAVNSPLLVIEGVVYMANGSPIEHLRSIYRADRYEFSISPVRT